MEKSSDLTDSFEFVPPGSEEDLLSQFVEVTGADPAFAQDILSTANNNLGLAVEMYKSMMDPTPPPPPATVLGAVDPKKDTPNQTKDTKRRIRKKRRKGIVCVSDEVKERFHEESKFKCSKVDVGEELVPVIDDKFFQHTFLFPDVSMFSPPDLVEFLSNDLLEISHKKSLEKTGRLNWWTATGQCPPLDPLATSGDGNCLLHAASLGMWGVPDNSLILRSAVHKFLSTSTEKEGVQRRWKYQLEQQFQEQGGFTLSEDEWGKEWGELIRIATSEQRSSTNSKDLASNTLHRRSSVRPNYESLEEIHVFVLAHVLKRPVIVLANTVLQDMHGQDFAPIYFSGIYLPLEYNPKHCFKSPIVLAYEGAHFSPLLAKDTPSSKKQSKVLQVSVRNQAVIPLVSPDGHMLTLQFVVDPKKDNVDEFRKMAANASKGELPDHYITLLESYMDVRWISLTVNKKSPFQETTPTATPWKVPSVRFPAAQILYQGRPTYQEALLKSYYRVALDRFEEYKEDCREMEAEKLRRQEEASREVVGDWERMPCRTEGCAMFGTVDTNFLCSQCYRNQQDGDVKGKSPQTSDTSLAGENDPVSNGSSTSVASTQISSVDDVQPSPTSHSDKLLTHGSINTTQANGNTTNHSQSKPKFESEPLTKKDGVSGQPSSKNDGVSNQPSSKSDGESNQPSSKSDGESNQPSSKSDGESNQQSTKQISEKASAIAQKIAENVRRSPVLGSKRVPYTRGYSRDHVQPLGMDEIPDQMGVGTQKRPICKGEGCDFFASEQFSGYCSQCFKKQSN